MVGIVSFGVYVPWHRLKRSTIKEGLNGNIAIGSFDEDSITMSVEAGVICLEGLKRDSIDGVFIASTTAPYKEGQSAAVVATALDLRRDLMTVDFTNSPRSGITALMMAADIIKSGSLHNILVIAADHYRTAPGSDWEPDCGDGAVAFLVSDKDVIASVEASYSSCRYVMDFWRSQEDTYVRSGESRFYIAEGYIPATSAAIEGLLKKQGIDKKDVNRIIMPIPGEGKQSSLARNLGFDKNSKLQGSLYESIGDTGTAYVPMLLASALAEAKAGELMLVCSYGEGTDAILLKVTDKIDTAKNAKSLNKSLSYKKEFDDYKAYLQLRCLYPVQRIPYPLGEVSIVRVTAEIDQNVRLYGVKCKACGAIQFPPQRVCIKCQTKDQFDRIRLSDKKGTLFTFSMDFSPTFAAQTPTPTVIPIINFDGGGRMQCFMTDFDLKELSINMPVEMTFRNMNVRGGVHNYSWKCKPIRN